MFNLNVGIRRFRSTEADLQVLDALVFCSLYHGICLGFFQTWKPRFVLMRVLLIANYSKDGGGISVQVKLLQEKLRQEGVSCDILSTRGSLLQRMKSVFRLYSQGRKYDVFHIHACSDKGFLPAIIGVTSGRFLGKRTVLTYHGGGAEGYFRKHPRLVRYYLSRTSANIVLSEFIGQVFKQYGLKYSVIPNIIELHNHSVRERDIIHPNYICIRALSETYNLDCTLRAFETVVKKKPKATLTILGDGPSRIKLENMVRKRRIPHVSFVGHIDNEDIYQYLDKADVMVSSSRFDNMPVSILEGFNAGLLVVASRVGGVPCMIEDGKNGLLFDNDDAAMMADKMLYVIDNQQQSLKMIDAERLSLGHYCWENNKVLLFNLYNGDL